MVGDKFRIRFRKRGDLRFLSHHDLMRAFERMLRRAAIPFRRTGGFHPQPRLVFPLSLPLGVIGLHEPVELELTEPADPDDVVARLASQAPTGLEFIAVRRIPMNQAGHAVRAVYRVAVPADRLLDLEPRCSELLAQTECIVQRQHPQPRRVDIRPYVLGFSTSVDSLSIDLRVTPTGTARADEVLALLGLSDLLDAGAILERTFLELHDELAADCAPDAWAATTVPISPHAAVGDGEPLAPVEC